MYSEIFEKYLENKRMICCFNYRQKINDFIYFKFIYKRRKSFTADNLA